MAILAIATVLLVAWRNDVGLREDGLRDAERQGRETLAVFADHAVQVLDYGDSHLRAARAVYQRTGGGEELREFLDATKLAHGGSLFVATTFSDRGGQIVFDSGKRELPNVTAADLDYFRHFQAQDHDIPYIDPTRFGRVQQTYIFRIVRRVSRNGRFDGVAILNMRPDDLANFTHQFNLGPNATYSILSLDHRLILRQPAPPVAAYGERQDGLELWQHLRESPSGKFRVVSPFDGRARLYLYQKLPDYPLVVTLGIDEQDMLNHLAEMRAPNVRNATVFTVVTLVLCLLALLVFRKSGALERANATLAQSELRLARAMDATSDGLWEWNIASGDGYFSPAYYRMLGYENDEFPKASESWLERIHAEDRERTLAANQDCIDNRIQSFAVEYRMRAKDGSWRWILGRGKALERDSQGKALRMIGTHQDITERKRLEDQVRQMAFHDPLTGLPNRRLLMDRMQVAIAASRRSGRYGAVMFLDLDHFKPLNDTHGHEAGDLLLIEAANRLKGCVREVDTVGRVGGDELVVMLGELNEIRDASMAQAGFIAEKISAALAVPYRITIQRDGRADTVIEFQCTVSIGVVLFIDDEARLADLLTWADTAMYAAKAAGRNSIRFYEAAGPSSARGLIQ